MTENVEPLTDEEGRRMLPRSFPSLSLEVEVSAGTDVKTASRDLVGLADFLGLCVTAKFNEILLMAHPGGNADWLEANWWTQMKSKFTHRIAVSYRLDQDRAALKGGEQAL